MNWSALAQTDVDNLMDSARTRLRALGVSDEECSITKSREGMAEHHALSARGKELFVVTVDFLPKNGGFDLRAPRWALLDSFK